MKIYKIKLSNRDEITLAENKLLALLASEGQLVKVNISPDEWELINKAHIVNAKIDTEETRRAQNKLKQQNPELLRSTFRTYSQEETKRKMAEVRASLEANIKLKHA